MKENKKKCRTCEVEKSLDEYYQIAGGKRLDPDCKDCRKEKLRRYSQKNKNEISKKRKEKYYANHDKNLKRRREYRQKNKEKIKERKRKYQEKNKEKTKQKRRERHIQIKNKECKNCHKIGDYKKFNINSTICKNCQSKYNKQYHKENRDKISKKQREYQRKKILNDPKFRLNRIISGGIRHSLENGKDGRHWEDIVGYTITELKNHLESLWESWMNWENHGPYDPKGPKTWQIDHIIPKSMFDFESYEDEEFKLCWSLRNLQPKCSKMNNLKRDRYIG